MNPDAPIQTQAMPSAKTPVVRGARACTVCRAAKMKCVGAEDGTEPCQRCKRSNLQCIFEKHRRGRKPGSKLSEASKMLRRLEKGLSTAKLKQVSEAQAAAPAPVASASGGGRSDDDAQHLRSSDGYGTPARYPDSLSPLNLGNEGRHKGGHRHGSQSLEEQEEDDGDRGDEGMFPAKLIRRENQRQPFFKTILNPEHEAPAPLTGVETALTSTSAPDSVSSIPGLHDPVTSGIVDEANARLLFDLLFLRLNPFINLFDPALHSVAYVRSKSPFLFTTLIMAGCKFFKPESYKACQKLAHEFAVRAFAEGWKSVEVVQAFACLTYWKEPDDTRTWTYIGYACRMAVELGLNRHVPHPSSSETEFQLRERRNRERTYLVLFVHDRSLSMQTGRQWMLSEDDLVRHSSTWHEEGGTPIRPEDVIVAAFVQLRRLAAEPTDVFYLHKGSPATTHSDVNQEVLLRNCNGKLTQWMETWQHEMRRANGESFHFSFLSFFRLYVRLFLNSFGIQASMSPQSRASPSLQALSACYTSALENLSIVAKEFASMNMLRYGQDSVTVMTAYSAVFLLKLLRSSNTLAELHEGATNEIHSIISKTADAYEELSGLSPASTSAAYHARFLRGLVAQDIFKARQNQSASQAHNQLQMVELYNAQTDSQRSSSPCQSLVRRSAMVSVNHGPTNIDQSQVHGFHFPSSANVPSPHASIPQRHHDGSNIPSPTSDHGDLSGVGMNASNQSNDRGLDGYSSAAYAYPTSALSPQANTAAYSSELDVRYWHNMFREIGFGENADFTQNQSLHAVSMYAHNAAAAAAAGMGGNTAGSHGIIGNVETGYDSSSALDNSNYGRNISSYALQGQFPFHIQSSPSLNR